MSSAVLFQIQSACILIIMYVGVIFRRNRSLHIKMMSTAIIWDLLLILQIELTRSAIAKAAESMVIQKSALLNFHVFIAVSCVILYGVMFYTGRKIIKGNTAIKSKHRYLGITTLILRTTVFVTSFFVASR